MLGHVCGMKMMKTLKEESEIIKMSKAMNVLHNSTALVAKLKLHKE